MSFEPGIESGMKDLKVSAKTDINILLIGETGVGKSTFINALANYLTYKDFNIAKKEELLVLIPSEFIATDINGEFHVINVGKKANDESSSSKQFIKTYVFPIWNGKFNLRLIDTPGMGSINGIDQDNVNTDNILRYIGQLNVLHAIIFVLKPNQTNSAEIFRQSMSYILSQLDKSAGENIIFVFTNTRGTEYGPGDMMNLLKNEVDAFNSGQLQLVIPMNRNIFCFDNEPFRFLAGIKNNIQFDDVIEERNRENWKNSLEQCWKLITYIVGNSKNQYLNPHHIKSSSAINEARRMINQLKLPLVDIYQLISDNINSLQRHEASIRLDNQSLDQLTNKLYIPIVYLNIRELKQPVAICTSRSCAELYSVYGNSKWLYKPCQEPSSLTMVPKEIIGIPVSALDTAVESSNCPKCGCDFAIHMHVYYLIDAKEGEETDKRSSCSSKEVVEIMKQILKIIDEKKGELEKEIQFIITTCSKFSFFLENNSITSFNDSLKEYIEYLIDREKALGKICNQQTINCLEKFLKEYEEIKSTLENVHRLNKKIGISISPVTPKDISESIQNLYKLKHTGKTLKELYNCQKKARNHEYMNSEYVKKIEFRSDEKQGAKMKQINKKPGDGKHEKNKKEGVNDKEVMKNTTDKNGKKNERDPKSQDSKGNLKEKGNKEEKNNTKQINDMKKEKDKKVVNKNNKKEGSIDEKELDGKEQSDNSNNKKGKKHDMKGREKNIDAKSGWKKRTDDNKRKDKNICGNRNEQVSVNRRPPIEGATSRNPFQKLEREAPPPYQEIHQRGSQLPNTVLDGAHSRQGGHPHSFGHHNYGVEAYSRPHEPLSAQNVPRANPYGPYNPPPPVNPYGPPPVNPYGPPPVGDPYGYRIDYRRPIIPPREESPIYNINIKMEKTVEAPQSLPNPYLSTPYVASQGSHGLQSVPPAPYQYSNPPFDPHRSSGQQYVSKRAPPSSSSRGNARGRGGNRGKVGSRGTGKGRGVSNRRSYEKKSSKNSEGKNSDSDSDDSEEFVIVE